MEPAEAELLLVGITGSACVENDRLALLHLDRQRLARRIAIDHSNGRMVGGREWLDRPLHPRRKIVLKRVSPAPDCCLIGDVRLTIDTDDAVTRIDPGTRFAAVGPDWMGLPIGLKPVVPATPAAPVRAAPALQPIADEPQVRRRIALHNILVPRIVLTQRADAADISVEPLVRDFAKVWTCNRFVPVT